MRLLSQTSLHTKEKLEFQIFYAFTQAICVCVHIRSINKSISNFVLIRNKRKYRVFIINGQFKACL